MSFGLRWGEDNVEGGGFIFFDAVTVSTENYSGQVTKHPVANGASISDHFIRNNPLFTMSTVITGYDISMNSYLIQDLVGNTPYNVSVAPDSVSVTSTDDSILKQFIPDSIGQFLPDSTPQVTVDGPRLQTLDSVKDSIVSLMSGVIFNEKKSKFVPNIQLVRLFEYDGTLLKKIINNLVITSMVFREDINTGEGLYCDLTFEQVTFATLKKTQLPPDVVASLKKKSAPKASKGKQDPTVKPVSKTDSGSPDADPQTKLAGELP